MQENESSLNMEQTNKLQIDPIYKEYVSWLENNGVLIDSSVLYPAYFGRKNNGVVGIAARKNISNNYGIIAVPYRLVITVEKVKEDEELGKIISENPNIFQINEEAAFSILTLFVCKELIKEKKSFYAPYFAIGQGISLVNWSHWDMLVVENTEVIRLMKAQSEQRELNFMTFLAIFRRYPQIFPQNKSNTEYKKIFDKANNFICTRAFGWSLPSLSLIPLADSLNHNNQHVTHMLIDTKLEQEPPSTYKIQNKKYNLDLLSKVCPLIAKTKPPSRKKHRVDKFVDKHKQILQGSTNKDPQACILWHQYKAGVRNFRQLHYYDQSCEQDNDTDEQTIEKFEYQLQQFRFYERYQTKGITEKNKGKELIKYWKMFLDPVFDEDESSEEEEKNDKGKKKKDGEEVAKMKEKFVEGSKESVESSQVSSSSSSQSEDEELEWMTSNKQNMQQYPTTYFIMATKNQITKNQQIYNFYGRRSNRFLLVGYNFVLENNKYDSFAFQINVDNWKSSNKPFVTRLPVSKILNRGGKLTTYYTKEIRVKNQRICMELINHCRALLIGWGEAKSEMQSKKVTITIPFSIDFQKKVFALASQFIKTLQKQFMTSSEEDEELLQQEQKHEALVAIQLRKNYKQILEMQLKMILQCEECLKKWKNGKMSVGNEIDMRKLGKIRQYLCGLERAKI